ncbi:MAG: HAD family hydrolase [Elusimicrobia bacterium]|nr:HAD family hydrolase [Elusimicrobiota bacterium]
MPRRPVLRSILQSVARARRAGRRPLVVLDVDDTVLSTAPRHLRIMAEFAADRPRAKALLRVKPRQVGYFVVETAKTVGIKDESLLKELMGFWFKRFFTNDYLLADEPVPGAPEFCRRVVKEGGIPVYFTGRDETMRKGTVASLVRHGFPEPRRGGDAWLVLKERFDIPDLKYKDEGLGRIKRRGQVVAGFENEPAHINLFHDHCPDAVNVFVDTRHSGKPIAVKEHLPVIKDFR